jgi:hypothetical protein
MMPHIKEKMPTVAEKLEKLNVDNVEMMAANVKSYFKTYKSKGDG